MKLEHETFKKPTKNFWHDWENQKESYDSVTIWWEIGKLYFKILATHYCVQMQKNIRNKQTELTEIIKNEKNKPNLDQHQINKANQHLQGRKL